MQMSTVENIIRINQILDQMTFMIDINSKYNLTLLHVSGLFSTSGG